MKAPDSPPEPSDAVRAFLAGVARRQRADGQIEGDPALLADGWRRRSVVDPARAEELMALYRTLGLEARAEPVLRTQLGDECAGCRAVILASFLMLYTRDPRGRDPEAPAG